MSAKQNQYAHPEVATAAGRSAVGATQEFASMRKRLASRLSYLHADIEAGIRAGRSDDGDGSPREVQDEADAATDVMMGALNAAQLRRDAVEAREITDALGRIDAGSYGECEVCGGTIDVARLQVQPAARRCVSCQEYVERKQRGGSPSA
jgi:DnaK suppressor protein